MPYLCTLLYALIAHSTYVYMLQCNYKYKTTEDSSKTYTYKVAHFMSICADQSTIYYKHKLSKFLISVSSRDNKSVVIEYMPPANVQYMYYRLR